MDRNIRLVIEYDGGRYDGWQHGGRKTSSETVRDKLVEVLKKMTGEEIDLIGAERTETGAHAYEQVANFHTNSKMKCWEIKYYFNRYLPRDIAVTRVDDVPDRFHASYNAIARKYVYRVATGDVPCVFDRKYTYYCFDKLDIAAMKKAAKYLIGEHDFKAFCSNKRYNKATVRTIYDVDIYADTREVQISVYGDSFLTGMVRIIAGTLLEIGTGDKEPEDMKAIIHSKDRDQAGEMLPGQGLFLQEIEYKEKL